MPYSIVTSTKPNRSSSEDRAIFIQGKEASVMCVCDGHGGTEAADFIIHRVPKKLLTYRGDIVRYLKDTDVDLLRHLPPRDRHHGTTLAAIVFKPSHVHVVSLGDSSVFMYVPRAVSGVVPPGVERTIINGRGTLYQFHPSSWSPTTRADVSMSINMGGALGDWHLKNKNVYNDLCRSRGCERWKEKARNVWCTTHQLECDPWPTTRAYNAWVKERGGRDDGRLGWVSNTATVTRLPTTVVERLAGGSDTRVMWVVCSDGVTDNLSPRDPNRTLGRLLQRNWSLSVGGIAHEIVEHCQSSLLKPDDITVALLRRRPTEH